MWIFFMYFFRLVIIVVGEPFEIGADDGLRRLYHLQQWSEL